MENLIQAFSRTNRIFDGDKQFGVVKWYRYPYTMKKRMEDAFKLYSGSNPYGVFVPKLEKNLNIINSTFLLIKTIFDNAGIQNFSTVATLSQEEKAKFAKEFVGLNRLIKASIIQGFNWEKDTYLFEHDSSDTIVKICFDRNIFLILAQRYKELFKKATVAFDSPLDIDADAYEIKIDTIDSDYLNAKFKKYIENLYCNKEEKEVDNLNQQLHDSFAFLSEEDQKFANQILNDIQNQKLKIIDGSKCLTDYITEYKIKEKNDQIHKFAEKLGVDEIQLRELISLKPNEANLNDYGRFDAFIKTLKLEIAQIYFSGLEGKKTPMPMVKAKAENLAREFIIKGGYDL